MLYRYTAEKNVKSQVTHQSDLLIREKSKCYNVESQYAGRGGGPVVRRSWVNFQCRGVCGRVVLGKLPVPGRPTIWISVGQGPTALEVGAGGGCLDIFTLIYPFFPLSPSLWETARYGLKYCLKGPLNPKPTNQQPLPGVLLVWIRAGQGPTALAPTALAVGAGGACFDIFTLICPFSSLSPSHWETTRYRLKYCLKGSLSPKTTNQPMLGEFL